MGIVTERNLVNRMMARARRRLVVVDDRDGVVGVLTTDNIDFNLRSMSEELAVRQLITTRRSTNRR